MARSILAIIAGYLVFGFSAALLFSLSGQDPRSAPSVAFAVGEIAHGILFATAAGFLAALLAPRKPALHAGIVVGIIAAIALLSLALEFRTGSVWSQVAALALMAPAALIGGRIAGARRPQKPERDPFGQVPFRP